MNSFKLSISSFVIITTFSAFAFPAIASAPGNGADMNATSAIITGLSSNAVSSAELKKMRGGFGVVGAVNLGADSGNNANNSLTGSILNGQSVNGNTGLTTVIQNTGNNSLLQSSMTVNITVH